MYMHVRVDVYVRVHVQVRVRVHVHTYTCIHIHRFAGYLELGGTVVNCEIVRVEIVTGLHGARELIFDLCVYACVRQQQTSCTYKPYISGTYKRDI